MSPDNMIWISLALPLVAWVSSLVRKLHSDVFVMAASRVVSGLVVHL